MANRRPDLLVIIGGAVIFIIGVGYLLLYLFGTTYQEKLKTTPQANLTMLPADVVPTINNSYLVISPTVTPTPSQETGARFQVDNYVQIIGTGGNGLRLRSNPGTDALVIFVAAESEVFKVVAGPTQTGSYDWWQLVAPYDSSRQGWAAGEYLSSVTP